MEKIQLFLATLMAYATGSQDDEEGQTMIEYGLIVALISIVAILTLTVVGGNIKDVFNSVAGKLHS
jgi:pilus assembly protein Flp/PilA